MFCRNCGKQIPNTARFCNFCGTIVEQPPSASSSGPAKAAPAKSQNSPRAGISGYIGFFAVVAFIIAGWLTTSLHMSIPEIVAALKQGEPLRYRALYDLEDALEEKDTIITIHKDDWDTNLCPWEQAEPFLRDYLGANPELFYVDIKNTQTTFVDSDNPSYTIKIAYFDELTSERAEKELEAAADSLIRTIPKGATDWEKALHLHDALICHVTYEFGDMDQTAYSALVNGKAVCMGYAMAYEYLLTRAGIECDTVIGYVDELSASTHGTWLQMPQHAWSIVTFYDGDVERSYYVDTTWDDPGIKNTYGMDYINHRWFCVTQEDMDREGRSTLDEFYDVSRWNLDDETMNYYVYTDAIIDSYDINEVIRIMRKQFLQGNTSLSLRMTNRDTYYAFSIDMEHNGGFQKLQEALGIGAFNYSYAYDSLHDGLICFDIYLYYPEQ